MNNEPVAWIIKTLDGRSLMLYGEEHMKSEQIKHSLSVGTKSIQSRVFDRETDEVISFVKIPIKDSGLVRCEWIELTDEEIGDFTHRMVLCCGVNPNSADINVLGLKFIVEEILRKAQEK
jgi:hypothetical protein